MAGNKRKSSAEKQPKHRLPLGADADMLAAASKLRHKGAAKLHQADQEASIPVGKFLSRYTSGKIPKAFKRIPSFECWAEERNCTLREAIIIGSIIQKISIPFLHASVALVKLAEMEYCGTNRLLQKSERTDQGSCNRGEKDNNLPTYYFLNVLFLPWPISVITKPIEEDKCQ
ncbi:hypothetical protein HU200_058038 [Digitaria exilis]|uniref:Uncharacterized protein n=1 Tax=Digitaria exilis TaxID=1010633 RepID=A0A835E3P5_9POAL|nr:hypothetical protein HU200_058038 [Digitaria exilis]